MIRLIRPSSGSSVTTMSLAGQEFDIELLHITEEDRVKVFRKFRKNRQVVNPVSKQVEILPFFDDNDPAFKSSADDLLDQVVLNFHGIGDETGKEYDGTLRENKLLLGSIEVEDVEDIPITDEAGDKAVIHRPRIRPFRALIFDKAVALSKAVAEADKKN
jgi:hypothetical protein